MQANGMPVDKRLSKDPEWADAPYCVEMCRQVNVLTARH